MIDARRMEVYTAVYDSGLKPATEIDALIVNETSLEKFEAYPRILYFGDGMPKCKSMLGSMKNAGFIENIYPSAQYMIQLVYSRFKNKEFENLAYFEPFYLKDFIAGKKKSGI